MKEEQLLNYLEEQYELFQNHTVEGLSEFGASLEKVSDKFNEDEEEVEEFIENSELFQITEAQGQKWVGAL